jgi:hypothetical protein
LNDLQHENPLPGLLFFRARALIEMLFFQRFGELGMLPLDFRKSPSNFRVAASDTWCRACS